MYIVNDQLDGSITIYQEGLKRNGTSRTAMSLAMSKETSVSGEAYNLRIRRFPGNIFAGMFGYDAVQYFQADASASIS